MKKIKRLNKFLAAAMALSVAAVSVFVPVGQEAVYASSETTIADKAIAHGGGAVEGFETTNSQEAVVKAISDGYRYIELDMDLSSDNKVIMIHDWDKTAEHYFGRSFSRRLSAGEFSKILVNGKFKTLTFDSLVKILDDARDRGVTGIKIITDTKGDNVGLLTAIAQQYPEYIDYIIPQIYDYGEYEAVRALGYDEIYFTLYMLEDANFNEIMDFVQSKGIDAVIIGTDYYAKGLDVMLANAGVKVYCHPVNDYEEAMSLMSKGIYGVYSSFLLPGDFCGEGVECFLQQTNEKGQKVKLTDVKLEFLTADYIKSITIHGMSAGDMLHYEFDGTTMDDSVLLGATDGMHTLTIDVFKPGGSTEPYTVMTYYIWKCGEEARLTDAKYAYRLEELKPLPQFDDVMKDKESNVVDILSGSLIVKKGEHYFYNNGELNRFYVDQELLNVQSYSNGMAAIPLADTARALGAFWVDMDAEKYIYVKMSYDENAYVSLAGTCYVHRDFRSLKMKSEVEIYRRKALASMEYFEFITGRPYIDNEELAILLPSGTKLTKAEREKLAKTAIELY